MLPNRKKIVLLIYSTEVHSNIVIYTFAKLAGIKIVTFVPEFYEKYIFEGSFLRKVKWYGFLFNFSFLNKLSTKLIVFSYYLKEKYVAQGFKESDIIIQPNVTDFGYWMTGNASNKYTLGYSGSPSIKDGLHDLFKAIGILKVEGLNISLLVVGDNPFGKSLLPGLEKECEKIGIREDVTFSGLVELDEVRKLLSQCEILTLTRPLSIQTQAGFPTKLGEYIALKKKVLVTDFGDIEKYFEKGTDLVIAKSGDVINIAENIKWIISHNKESEMIAAEGYKTAIRLLEYKSITKKIAGMLVS